MPWIIDTDIFIEGERGHAAFVTWLQSEDGIATADVVRGEFLIGVHAVADETIRQRGSGGGDFKGMFGKGIILRTSAVALGAFTSANRSGGHEGGTGCRIMRR